MSELAITVAKPSQSKLQSHARGISHHIDSINVITDLHTTETRSSYWKIGEPGDEKYCMALTEFLMSPDEDEFDVQDRRLDTLYPMLEHITVIL